MQDAQQLDLKGRRGVADFIEQQGAAIGTLEQPDVILMSAGEGAAFVPEQLGLQQGVGQRRAVLHDEGIARARAGVMDGPGQQLFARPRLAQQQHRQIVARDPCGQLADRIQRSAGAAHDTRKIEGVAHPLQRFPAAAAQRWRAGAQFQVQSLHMVLQRLALDRIAHGVEQVFRQPGLEQVLIDTGLIDARDDVFRIGVARQHDADHPRPALAHFLEKFDTADMGHALVAEDHRHHMLFKEFTCLRGGLGQQHLEFLIEYPAQRFARTQLIVHYQDHGQVGLRVEWGGH